jgi:hypothetical protein
MTWRLENDPDFYFEFFLAEKLHKTVGEIRLMDQYEFLGWVKWYQRKALEQELANKLARGEGVPGDQGVPSE